MKTFAAALLGLCLSTVAATAQTNEDIHRALGEVAGELQICSVYFGVVARCLKTQEPAIARTYREASDKVGLLAISTGLTVGISSAASVACWAHERRQTTAQGYRPNDFYSAWNAICASALFVRRTAPPGSPN